ncbi:MAG: NAD(P)/FAD-dependent oxidoreductase [Pseudomonadales bacterium]
MTRQLIIVGGGHNGLVCGCYLARAGHKVTILERRHIVGGAAVTEEFHPGFRNSVASYTVSLLHPGIIADLNLEAHGLRILPRRVNNYVPLPDGDALVSPADTDRFCAEVERFSSRDVVALTGYQRQLNRILPIIKDIMLMTPPNGIDLGVPDLIKLFRLSRKFRQLDAGDKRFLLKLFAISAGELLDDTFESEPIKALLGFDAVVGHYASPYTPGSAYVLLHHVLGQVNGRQGVWGHAVGGMGAITSAMAQEAKHLGVKIVTDAPVTRILVRNRRACGVTIKSGETLTADAIIANVNPKLLYCDLLDEADVAPATLAHFRQYKCMSGTFRMNVALSRLPEFTARQTPHCLEGGIIMAPSLAYMDEAYSDARRNGWSRHPVVEMLIPSLVDNTLAPPGQHVASLFCQHFDPGLKSKWNEHRQTAADIIIDTVSRYADGFRENILATQIHSPFDLEQKFGLVGGDIFHGRLSLDQLFSARPMLGIGQYRSDLDGLFMCGSGTHPGGGVSGIPGHNAAREILRAL